MHHLGMNGILADEMGLGKTLQTITFLTYLKVKLCHVQQGGVESLLVFVAPTNHFPLQFRPKLSSFPPLSLSLSAFPLFRPGSKS